MLYRALVDVSRSPRTLTHRFNAANFAAYKKFHGVKFSCPVCGAIARPLYDFPDIPLRIEHRIGMLRETLQCSHCVASMRQRSLAAALLDCVNEGWHTELRSMAELAANGLNGLRVLNTDNFSAMTRLLVEVEGYTRCSYLPDQPLGTHLAPGYSNQDLQHLSFPDSCFDILLTSDVMEHVRDCDSAHREIYRVLAPGGSYLFNVPCDMRLEEDIRLVDTTTAQDVFLCEPQFHGDPLSDGILAYRVFGRKLIERLESIGFEVTFHLMQRPDRLIIDGDVFVAHKPLGTRGAQDTSGLTHAADTGS
jgi:SAM-dependent methyltransferase